MLLLLLLLHLLLLFLLPLLLLALLLLLVSLLLLLLLLLLQLGGNQLWQRQADSVQHCCGGFLPNSNIQQRHLVLAVQEEERCVLCGQFCHMLGSVAD